MINTKRKAINTLYNTIHIQMFTVCTTPPPAKKAGVVQRLKPAKSNIYARPRAGLFFCLASAEGAGLFFLPGGVSATHKRLQRLFFRPCNYTAKTSKAFAGLYNGVSVDLPHSSAHNTADTQAAYAPLAPRRTLYKSAQPPIIIRYIRAHRCAPVVDPCPAVHHSADHASGGTTGGLPPHLFSAFRPIINRGQQ